MLLFILPLIAVALIVTPFILAIMREKAGKKVNRKRVVLFNALSFIGFMTLMAIVLPVNTAFAEAATAATGGGLADGFKYLGAALSTGMATIGTGIAVGGAAPAAIGATSEDDKNFAKSLIFVALGEGVAIYGLVISILILNS